MTSLRAVLTNGRYVGINHSLIGAVSIVCIDFHTEALGNTGYVTTYVTEGVDTEFLTLEFGAAGTVVQVTNGINHQTESEFSYGVGVLTRGVHRYNLMGRSRGKVNIVITGTGANHNLEVLGGGEYFLVHDVGTDDDSVRISYCVKQLLFSRIFLQESKFIACFLHHLADTVHSHFGKRFFCCYKYFHCIK